MVKVKATQDSFYFVALLSNYIVAMREREQDKQDRKRQDRQDKKQDSILMYYLAYPAACDPAYPVFLILS